MASHVKTFNFAASQESWVWTNTVDAMTSAARNATDQALEIRESVASLFGNHSAAGYWEWTGTWEDLGIAPGATVTHIQVPYDWRCTLATGIDTSQTGPFTLRNSSGTSQGTFSAALNFSATSSFATRASSNLAVPAGMQASNTTIKLRLEATLNGFDDAGGVMDVKLQHDNIAATITYEDPPDTTPPELESATIAADGQTWTLVFSEAVTGTEVFEYAGAPFGNVLNYFSGSGTDTLTFASPEVIPAGHVVTLSYLEAGGNVADLAENPMGDISDFAVTNESEQEPEPDGLEPGAIYVHPVWGRMTVAADGLTLDRPTRTPLVLVEVAPGEYTHPIVGRVTLEGDVLRFASWADAVRE